MSKSDHAGILEKFAAAGQGHVFAFWDQLSSEAQEGLIAQAQEIDLEELQELNDTLVAHAGEHGVSLEGIEPAPYVRHPRNGGDEVGWDEAHAAGEAALCAGRVAAFTVAGGQGTRLGYDGPKGTFPVTPVQGKTLFEVFAGKIGAAASRYGKPIPWLIMTSHLNHNATEDFFKENQFFGLDPEQVHFFRQGRMPAVGHDGKILLEGKDRIAMSPDGHGGSLRALVRSGVLSKISRQGIDFISYFQVDNPLVRAIDPAFIGFHLLAKSDLSSKMIPKAYAGEKLGHFCRQGEQTVVIEYSDLPQELQEQTDDQGKLRFIAGSIAIHIFSVDFIQRITEGSKKYRMPFHRADKKISCIQPDGSLLKPDKPNGIKFEMFVFDALPFARLPVVIETLRQEEFSPVKNAEGVDSPKSCREDQLRQYVRWLRAAEVEIETDESGLPPFAIEISSTVADSADEFVEYWNQLETKPAIVPDTVISQ